MVRQALKRYDEQHQQSVEGADMLPTDRSYESLFAAIVHEKTSWILFVEIAIWYVPGSPFITMMRRLALDQRLV